MAAAINPARGEAHYNSKLTNDDVRLIRGLVAEREYHLTEARKLTDEEIAKKFDIHPNTVWKVSRRAGWVHVPDPSQPEQTSL